MEKIPDYHDANNKYCPHTSHDKLDCECTQNIYRLISELQERNRDGILYCEEEANRGIQYKCKRERCYQTWVVGTQPPICKMFDYEKHLDARTTDSFNQGALAVIKEIKKNGIPSATKTWNNDYEQGVHDGHSYCGKHTLTSLKTLEAKIKNRV